MFTDEEMALLIWLCDKTLCRYVYYGTRLPATTEVRRMNGEYWFSPVWTFSAELMRFAYYKELYPVTKVCISKFKGGKVA